MKTTKAESFAVDSVACRIRSQFSRRLAAPRMSAPAAPIAPPSVGVAMPMKIVPSTRKIRNSGGTITNVVCCAICDRKRNPVSLSTIQFSDRDEEGEQDAEEHAEHDEIGAMRFGVSHHEPAEDARWRGTARPATAVRGCRPSPRKADRLDGGRPGAAFGKMSVTRKA